MVMVVLGASALLTGIAPKLGAQTRWRGANIESVFDQTWITSLTSNGAADLGINANANVIRFQLYVQSDQGLDTSNYNVWLEGELQLLERLLPACEAAGVKVILDLHTPPGGWLTEHAAYPQQRLFGEAGGWQTAFVNVWKMMAMRYRDNKTVIAYDLLNEPAVGTQIVRGALDWNALAAQTTQAIRKIDRSHTLIVESEYGHIDRLQKLRPIPSAAPIAYSVHMYDPVMFTDQALPDHTFDNVVYPGNISGKYWDANALRANLNPIRAFQLRYNAHIFIGEFSSCETIRDGSGQRYVSDLINIFESFNWDWCYEAYTSTPTGAELTTRAAFAYNPVKKYQAYLSHIATTLLQTGAESEFQWADFDHDGIPDLALIKKSNTGTGRTEVHVLSGASGYRAFLFNQYTALGYTGSEAEFHFYDYDHDGIPDLILVKKSNTGSGQTEIHALSGCSGYQTWMFNLATIMPVSGEESEYKIADWDNDGYADLILVKKSSTGTGRTEVHIASGRYGYQQYIMNQYTALGPTTGWQFELADYNRDGVLDLIGIAKPGLTTTNRTELHVLSGADRFQTFLNHRATALSTTAGTWCFGIADYNRDGSFDLMGILKQGASGRTEVHVLSGTGD